MGLELAAALCLVLVIEGLLLLVAPAQWKRMAEQMQRVDIGTLRLIGAGLLAIGVIALKIVQ